MFLLYKARSLKLTLCCLLAANSQGIYAEETVKDVVQLAPIIVQVTRTDRAVLTTPASAYYLAQQQQPDSIGVNLSETLKGVPGLQLNNRENYAQDLQISMRGFGARSTFGVRGVRLYVDGIPATMPDGQGQTSNIDLDSLEHIEVLSGPFSSLYGNSSGGTILTTSHEGQGTDSITLGYSAGSQNKNRVNLLLQGGSDRATEPAYSINSSYFETDGFREHSGAHKVLNNAKLSWELEDGSHINWINNYVKIAADDPGGLTRAQWQADPKQVASNVLLYQARKQTEQLQTGLTWNKPITDQQEIYLMAYWGQREITQYQSIPRIAQGGLNHAGGVIDFDRQFYGTDLRWTGKEILPGTRLIAGIAVDAMNEDRKGYQNFQGNTLGVKGELRRNEDNRLWNADPYLQVSYNFLPDWTLDAGLRYSNVHFKSQDKFLSNGDHSGQTDYQQLLPSLALSWQIMPELLAYASYAQGFETPTLTEMAYPADESGHSLNLKAAESETYEFGFKSANPFGNFTAAIFQTKTSHDIVSAGSEGGRSTFRNADQTFREGVELSWNKKLWRELTAQASYSYIDATFDADIPEIRNQEGEITVSEVAAGNKIPGIARHQAFLSVGWQPETGLHAGLDVRYSDRIYVNDTNTEYAPGYTVAAAHLGYHWKVNDWTLNTFSRVNNLFDRDYSGSVIVNESNKRYFEPAEGRNWSAGLSVTREF